MYILIAILIFGILVAVHEFGHFITAKLCGVRVLEFSIGMGPTLLKKQGAETLYSLRALPIGGFCAMEEDEASSDPRAFPNQSLPKKLLILVAGAGMNFLMGFALILAVFAGSGAQTTEITGFMEGCPYESETAFQVGDEIWKIDGHRVYVTGDISTFLSRERSTTLWSSAAGKRSPWRACILNAWNTRGRPSLCTGLNFKGRQRVLCKKRSTPGTSPAILSAWCG